MSEFNLGPNGAQIVASDMILENLDALRDALGAYEDYYVIFDTPGQWFKNYLILLTIK